MEYFIESLYLVVLCSVLYNSVLRPLPWSSPDGDIIKWEAEKKRVLDCWNGCASLRGLWHRSTHATRLLTHFNSRSFDSLLWIRYHDVVDYCCLAVSSWMMFMVLCCVTTMMRSRFKMPSRAEKHLREMSIFPFREELYPLSRHLNNNNFLFVIQNNFRIQDIFELHNMEGEMKQSWAFAKSP